MPDVSRETFRGYDIDSKLNTLFDYAVEAQKCHKRQVGSCNERFEALEKPKKFNKGVLGFVKTLFWA